MQAFLAVARIRRCRATPTRSGNRMEPLYRAGQPPQPSGRSERSRRSGGIRCATRLAELHLWLSDNVWVDIHQFDYLLIDPKIVDAPLRETVELGLWVSL
jgi:hypothetical protein